MSAATSAQVCVPTTVPITLGNRPGVMGGLMAIVMPTEMVALAVNVHRQTVRQAIVPPVMASGTPVNVGRAAKAVAEEAADAVVVAAVVDAVPAVVVAAVTAAEAALVHPRARPCH